MKLGIVLIGMFLPAFLIAQINVPAASPFATVKQAVGLAEVSIEYSRPSLRGRKMIGSSLIPYGKVWRTGANKVPKLTISKDVVIDGHPLPAGSYGMLTIPGLSSWTIILSGNADQFGSFTYKESEDKLRFNVKPQTLATKEESFSIGFADFNEISSNVYIKWENTQVKFKITHDPGTEILAEIKEKTSASTVSSDTYFSAAEYYYDKNINLTQALEWANKVVESDKQYWTYNLRGKIAAKLGKCDLAVSDAKEGLVLAKRDNDPAYIVFLNKILSSCKAK
jgi:hypothetical protein